MKILIVEDHSVYRDGMRQLLRDLGGEVEVLEARTGGEAQTAIVHNPDLELVLLDLTLPDIDGFAAMERFRAAQPTLPVVVLSASDNHEDMTMALDRGALGYVPKSTPSAVMLSAIRLVLSGGVYIPSEMLGHRALNQANGLALTNRQREVLELILKGQSNKEIARELGLSLPTVKAHVSAIFKALHVKNRTQVVVAAKRLKVGATNARIS